MTEPDVGLRDADLSGWFQNATGELFRGFATGPGDVVLDAGCGDGGNAAFCSRTGAHMILADIDAGSVAVAESRMAGPGGFQAFVTDCDPIPVPDATASKVICTEVLEHVDDPAQLLAELLRVGKPGAQYLLTVPDPAGEHLHRKLAPESYWRKPNHLRIIERAEFGAMVEAAGLVIEQRASYGFYHSLWWLMFWSCGVALGEPGSPVLENWGRTWDALIDTAGGVAMKRVMDEALPKSQLILARKPG